MLQGPLRSHTQKSLPHVAVFQPLHSLGRHAPMSYLVQAGAATAPSQHAAVQDLLAAPDAQRALQVSVCGCPVTHLGPSFRTTDSPISATYRSDSAARILTLLSDTMLLRRRICNETKAGEHA